MTEALVQLLDTWRVAAEPRRRMPCQREPRLWFSSEPSELERAKALCRTCPVRAACPQRDPVLNIDCWAPLFPVSTLWLTRITRLNQQIIAAVPAVRTQASWADCGAAAEANTASTLTMPKPTGMRSGLRLHSSTTC